MNWSAKRIVVACPLTAALALMICPPWVGAYRHGHRLLWNGRGSLDWSRLVLELCLVAVIGALAAVVAPMLGRPGAGTLKVWVRRAGLVLGCAAVLIVAATAAYDAIVYFTQLGHYERRVGEFRTESKVLEQAFPLIPSDDSDRSISILISNFYEAEIVLRRFGYSEQEIQWAKGQFLVKQYEGSVGFAFNNPVREIWFGFDRYAGERFFAPLPKWHTEALQHNIQVARVPYWMNPGEPPAPLTFTGWLGSRSPVVILAAGMLVLSVLCFVAAGRIDRTTAGTNSSVGGVRSGEGVL